MAKLGHTFKAFIIIIIKVPFYLLKINKRTSKKYFCDSNFEIRLYCHMYIYEFKMFSSLTIMFLIFF